MSPLRLVSIIAGLSAISAAWSCEQSYGIARRANLASYPSPECVNRAVEQVAEIESFDEHHEPNEVAMATQRFQNLSYRGLGVDVELGVFEEADHTRLIQSYLYTNRRPVAGDIDAARTLMMALEKEMEESCGIPGLGELVSEHCVNVECD